MQKREFLLFQKKENQNGKISENKKYFDNYFYNYTSKMMTLNMMAMDAKEGISAFLEKRKPKWKNK